MRLEASLIVLGRAPCKGLGEYPLSFPVGQPFSPRNHDGVIRCCRTQRLELSAPTGQRIQQHAVTLNTRTRHASETLDFIGPPRSGDPEQCIWTESWNYPAADVGSTQGLVVFERVGGGISGRQHFDVEPS